MRRDERFPMSRWMRAAAVAAVVAVATLVGAPAAQAEPGPTPEQVQAARAETATKVAKETCGRVPTDTARGVCLDWLRPALLGGDLVCSKSFACQALRPLLPGAQKAFDAALAINPVVQGATRAVSVVKFVADPTGGLDDLANKTKESSVDLAGRVLPAVVKSSQADLNQSWWLTRYAASAGLGVLAMGLCLLVMCAQTAQGKMSGDDFGQALLARAPLALLMILLAPGAGQILLGLAQSLALGLADDAGADIDRFLTTIGTLTQASQANGFPGGVLGGIAMYGFLAIGAMSTWVGMLSQEVIVTVTGLTAGIVGGLFVHPTLKRHTFRLIAFWAAQVLMKPLIVFLLWVAFGFINNGLSTPAAGLDEAVSTLVTVGIVLLVVGLTPWALLKWAPILPGGNQPSHTGGGGQMVEGVAFGAGGAALSAFGRARHMSSSAGGSRSSGGGRSTSTSHTNGSTHAGPDAKSGPGGQSGPGGPPGTSNTRLGGGGGAPSPGGQGAPVGAAARTAGTASKAGGGAAAGAGASKAAAVAGPVGMVLAQTSLAAGQAAITAARKRAAEATTESKEHRG